MSGFQKQIDESSVTGDFSQLEKFIKELDKDHYVDVGVLGAGSYEGEATIAGIGAVHEFGTDRAGRNHNITIPERSFIRMPIETGQADIEADVKPHVAKKLGEGDIKGIFKLIGIAAEKRIFKAFDTAGFGEWPDIKPATKKAKGASTILYGGKDGGTLRRAITSNVGGG